MRNFPGQEIRYVRFAAAATLSDWIQVPEFTALTGLIMPPTWTAGTLGFDGSMAASDPTSAPVPLIRQMYDESGIIALTVTQNTGMTLVRPRFAGLRWLRARSSVAQLDAREICLIFVPVL